MKLKNTLTKLYYYIKPLEVRFTNASLAGVSLQVLPGTIRSQTDQDDAWWFYLAKHHDIIFHKGYNIGYSALLRLVQNSIRNLWCKSQPYILLVFPLQKMK